MSSHVVSARRRGVTDAEFDALARPDRWGDVFSSAEVAALRLADAMSADSHALDPALVAELRAEFTEVERAEVLLVVAQANFNNRAGNAAKQLLGEG